MKEMWLVVRPESVNEELTKSELVKTAVTAEFDLTRCSANISFSYFKFRFKHEGFLLTDLRGITGMWDTYIRVMCVCACVCICIWKMNTELRSMNLIQTAESKCFQEQEWFLKIFLLNLQLNYLFIQSYLLVHLMNFKVLSSPLSQSVDWREVHCFITACSLARPCVTARTSSESDSFRGIHWENVNEFVTKIYVWGTKRVCAGGRKKVKHTVEQQGVVDLWINFIWRGRSGGSWSSKHISYYSKMLLPGGWSRPLSLLSLYFVIIKNLPQASALKTQTSNVGKLRVFMFETCLEQGQGSVII